MSDESIKSFSKKFASGDYFAARELLKEAILKKITDRKEKVEKIIKI